MDDIKNLSHSKIHFMKQTQTQIHYQPLATTKSKSKISLNITEKEVGHSHEFHRREKHELGIVEVMFVSSPCEIKDVFTVLIEIISY